MEVEKEKEFVWPVFLVRTRSGQLYTGNAIDVDRRNTEHGQARPGAWAHSGF